MPLFQSSIRRRWLFFLALILASAPQDIFANSRYVCYMVRPGETASQVALRLTGNPLSLHAQWFQIVDPARSRFIQKSQYGLILPNWQACIAVQSRPAYAPPSNSILELWWIPLFLLVPAIWFAAAYVDQREAARPILKRFGNEFIREFERPLIQQSSAGFPVRSRLRVIPHRQRLEIFLAPQNGRRYPNLSDHRKNLEYDVERVVQLLGDPRFVSRQLAARGPWVVIPFQFQSIANKEGGP
jgi:hypothetical protein